MTPKSVGLYVLVLSCIVASHASAAGIPISELRAGGHKWKADALVSHGLALDRQWVLDELLWKVENEVSERALPALVLLEEHGDAAIGQQLSKLADTLSSDPKRESRARAARISARRLVARGYSTAQERAEYWIEVTRTTTGLELRSAVDELGETGHPASKARLLSLSGEVTGTQGRFAKFGAVPDDIQRRIGLALEKNHLLSSRTHVQAYARAAEGTPRDEFMERPEFDCCPLKLWGIRKLGEIGTADAKGVLLRLFESYETQFKDLLKVSQGREKTAYQAFRIGNMSEYYYETYRALQKAGRDVRAERSVAGADALRRIQ